MNQKKTTNYFIDLTIMILSVLISISGLALIAYHGHRDNPDFLFMNFNKVEWLLIHKIVSVAVAIGIIIHIMMHSGWLKNSLKGMAFLKSEYKNKSLFYLFALFFVSAVTGFVPWIFAGFLPDGGREFRHAIMEFHDKVSLILIILFLIHFIKKIKWFFNTTCELVSKKK